MTKNYPKQQTFEQNCDGCIDFERELKFERPVKSGDISFSCVPYNHSGQCPCTTCIIKIMCKRTCNELERWYTNLKLDSPHYLGIIKNEWKRGRFKLL